MQVSLAFDFLYGNAPGSMSLKKLSVFGLGKFGACMAATFAERGFDVLGVDINPEPVHRINAGRPPVDEPLLPETIARAGTRLRASTAAADAVATDASFFIVPSPSLPDGSFSNEFLMRALAPLAQAVRKRKKKNHIFIVSSTTTPGACRKVIIPMLEKETGGKCGKDFGFCYNPEFIALGNVVSGLLAPDLVLIGESDPQSGKQLEALYRKYNTNRPHLARMSVTSAELTKISVNSYITAKISFTNQLRMIAERRGYEHPQNSRGHRRGFAHRTQVSACGLKLRRTVLSAGQPARDPRRKGSRFGRAAG